MPTLPSDQPVQPQPALHRARGMAESFGTDAERYDRARPSYPAELVARVIAGSPGRDVLDVGTGTGIAACQFQAAGCRVLGVEPDARMAEFARSRGMTVEVARFEDWPAAGRRFDTVIAAQSWHWIDPMSGIAKAADVLRPRGRLAIFGHVFEPPDAVAEPFAAAFRRLVPDSPFANQPARRPLELYEALYANIAESISHTGQFTDAQRWRFEWQQDYTRDQWLELLPTTGALTQVPADKTAEIQRAVGSAIDALGGHFTMPYVTLAATAIRVAVPEGS